MFQIWDIATHPVASLLPSHLGRFGKQYPLANRQAYTRLLTPRSTS